MSRPLIYLSTRKLASLAEAFGLDRSALQTQSRDRTFEASASVPGVGQVSLRDQRHADRDPSYSQNFELLRGVERKLEKEQHPRLDDLDAQLSESGWFYFHRPLRFGIGHADLRQDTRAFILVDRAPMDTKIRPGLLLHGDPSHVLEPYRDGLADRVGARSGSGTDPLFNWLTAVEHGGRVAGEGFRAGGRGSRDPEWMADALYQMFARMAWRDPDALLANTHVCEGIALTSVISASEAGTVVVASPLAVRISPLPDEPARPSRPSWRDLFTRPRRS